MHTPVSKRQTSILASSIASLCSAGHARYAALNLHARSTALPAASLWVLALCLPAPVLAANVNWLGGTGNWSPATFWSTGLLPTAADHAFVDGGQLGTGSAVNVNVAASVGSLTIDAGDFVNNTNAQSFSVFGPFFNINGTFNNGNGANLVFSGTTTMSGTGEIVLGTNASSRIHIDGNNSFTIGADNVVHGHSGDIGGQIFVGGTATLINNGLIAADVDGGTIGLSESAVTNNGTLRATNGGTLSLNVAVSGGVLDANNGTIVQNGMRIAQSTLMSSNGGVIRASASSFNFLDAAVLDGVLDLTSGNARERVQNGLTLNGTINIDNGGSLSFENNQALDGNGHVVFGSSVSNRLDLDGNGTTTIGQDVTIEGKNGVIGGQINIGGTQTLVNNGTISANVAGGTLTLIESAVTNNGLLQAVNGATLVLSSHVSGGVSGAIDAGSGSVVLQNGVTLAGIINTSGDGVLRAVSSGNNFLSGVSLNGKLDLTLANARERVTAGGMTLNGSIDINNNASLSFEGTGTLSGTGSIVLGATGGGNRVDFDGNGTTTLGENITIRGQNGTIGGQINIGGTQTLVNNGSVSADVAGGTLTIIESAVTNNGVLEAINGGTLVLSSNVTGGPGGAIHAGLGSLVLQNGVTLAGTINTSGSGVFRAVSSGTNFLSGVTLNGNLDLTSVNARERVSAGGMTLNGNIQIDNNASLSFEGNGTLSGTGTIILGTAGAGNRVDLDGNGTTVIGEHITIRGKNGTIGSEINVGGTQTLINHGVIAADEAGGTVTLVQSAITNHGLLKAANGGTLVLATNISGVPGGAIEAGVGSTVLQSGVVLSGTINAIGDGLFQANTSGSNFLEAVSFNGALNLTLTNARERVKAGGMTLNGRVDIDNNAILSFEGNGALGGVGSVVFGAAGPGNRLDLDGNGTTTIGADITIRGKHGSIGNQINVGGTQTLVNNGLISADVAGGTISVVESTVDNNGVMRAINGGKLALGSRVNGGVVHAGVGSEVNQNGVTLSGVTIESSGDGRLRANSSGANFLNSALVTGKLDMGAGNARERVTGGLSVDGRVDIDNGGILSFEGSSSLAGNGEVVFGAGPGNRLDLDGNGTTTIGANMTIRGANGAIGNQINIGGTQTLVNDGTIMADESGGTLTFVESAVINNGVLGTVTGSTLAINSSVVNATTGVIQGNGTVVAPGGAAGLLNQGHVAPGLSPGVLTIAGNYTQAASGFLDIELGSLASSDKLVVTGNANLNGTLALHCFASCAMNVGDTLTVLDAAAGGLSGQFFSVALFGFATGQFDIEYNLALGDVRLVVTEAVSAVPLPTSVWMMLSALGLLAVRARRQK